MVQPSLQDCSRVDVEHLYPSGILSRDQHLAILPNLSASSNFAKARDGFDEFPRPTRVDLNARARRYGEAIAAVRDMRDGKVGRRGNEQLVLERFPITLLRSEWRRPRGQLDQRQRSDLGGHGQCLLCCSSACVAASALCS